MTERGLLEEDHSEIKLVPDESRSAWFRHSDPWRVDHRRTCICGHRYHVHSKGGPCLAADTPPDQRTGQGCQCHEWSPQ